MTSPLSVNDLDEERVRRANEAVAVFRSGRPAEAAVLLADCLALFPASTHDSKPFLTLQLNLGSAYAESGQLNRARWTFEWVLAQATAQGDALRAAQVHFNLGNVDFAACSWQSGIDHYRQCLAMTRDLANAAADGLRGRCLLALAMFYLDMDARDDVRACLAQFDELPDAARQDPELQWSCAMQHARLALADGAPVEAGEHLRRATAFAQQIGDAGYLAQTRAALAELDPAEAMHPARALALRGAYEYSRRQQSSDHWRNAFEWARSRARDGAHGEADTLFHECLDALERLRGQLDDAQRYHLMATAAPAVQHIVKSLMQRDQHTAAFEASEHAQGRAILDSMFAHQPRRQGARRLRAVNAGGIALAPPTLTEVVEDLAASDTHLLKLFFAEERLYAWWIAPDGGLLAWDASDSRPALERVIEVLVDWNTAGANERGAGMVRTPAAAPAPAMGDPPPFEAARPEPAAAEPATPVGAVPARWPVLAEALARWYATLFPEAIQTCLAGRGGQLVVVPHPAIFMVPFAAMPMGCAHADVLGQTWEIAVVPSAGCWLQLDPRRDVDADLRAGLPGSSATLPALVVGDCGAQSVTTQVIPGVAGSEQTLWFGDLRGARREVDEVRRRLGGVVLRGRDALKPSVTQWLPNAGVVHFATHGHWHALGDNSYVVLADTRRPGHEPGSNALFGRDVQALALRAELVVLSACQSGLGGVHPDSYIGLGQSFLIGGARAVLISLWPLDDEQTTRFIDHFYAAIGTGGSAAAALRATQAAFRDDPRGADGAFWAGFQLLGRPLAAPGRRALATPFSGPMFCGGDVNWPDSSPGDELPLAALRGLRLRFDQAAILGRDGPTVVAKR